MRKSLVALVSLWIAPVASAGADDGQFGFGTARIGSYDERAPVEIHGDAAKKLFEHLLRSNEPWDVMEGCRQVGASNVMCGENTEYDRQGREIGKIYQCGWTFLADGRIDQDSLDNFCGRPNGIGVRN